MSFRGAYIAKLDLTQPNLSGVAEKIRAQVEALAELPATMDLYHLADGKVVKNGEIIRSAGSGGLARRLAHYLLFHLVLASHREPLDFLYMRYQGSSPLLIWALGRLRKRNPGLLVIIEIPSWPYYSEVTALRDKLLMWIDRRSRDRLRNHVDRIVTFSREASILGIPTIPTDNGVDTARMTSLPAHASDGSLRLLGLANLSFWHGYDRVIEGMAQYYERGGSKEVYFDVVGTGNELTRLQDLAAQHGLADLVNFHGSRHGAELEAIMATADVGISSIGMHRLDVDTSNLKSREFCARGLPFVIGYVDRDFPDALPFVFHATADDTPLDIGGVLSFFQRLQADSPGYSAQMRIYTEEHLTWRAKLQPVLQYLRAHLSSTRASA
jgi:glycosyltransferase involved in cell wall biosynthesis